MTSYSEFDDSSSDNTKCNRIMSDFQEFLKKQSSIGAFNSHKPLKSVVHSEEFSVNRSRAAGDQGLLLDVDMKVKMRRLEMEHASEKQALIKSNIVLEAENKQLALQIHEFQEKCDKTHLINKQLTEQNLDLLDKVKSSEEEKHDTVAKWEANFIKLEEAKIESHDRMFKEISILEDKNNQLMEENVCLQSENNDLRLRLEEALSIGEMYNKKITETALLMQEYQKTLCELEEARREISSLKTRLNDVNDLEKSVQSFKEDMNRLRYLESQFKSLQDENNKLRENQENAALLNEKLVSVESKLNRARVKCERADELEIVNESLVKKLKNIDEQEKDVSALNKSQTEIAHLEEHVGLVTARNNTLQSEVEIFQKKYQEEKDTTIALNAKIQDLSEGCTSLTAQLQRLKKRAALLANERDSLRSILQSYDAELTMTSHTTQLSKRLTNAEESNKKLHTRIEQLEVELQKNAEEAMRRRLVAKQAASAAGKLPAPEEKREVTGKPNCDEYEKKIADLTKASSDREKEVVTLHEKIEQLEMILEQRKLRGGYDPRKEKVLHFRMNPADIGQQKFKQDILNLKEENIKLKKKLKEVEEGRDVSVSEIEVPLAAREELAKSELRNKRLKEVFSKKIQEFRQACYSLTGYRIDTLSDSQFRLVSMYAESEADCLLFKMSPDGSMQLLESEFSKTLTEYISLHLHHQNSIPMFLNAVSTNLFSQQTMIQD